MNYPPSPISESESDPNAESDVGSNERTDERTHAADRSGRQSGAGSRRTGAYEKDSPISEHSPEVSYYLARARESFREASAAIHKRDMTPSSTAPEEDANG